LYLCMVINKKNVKKTAIFKNFWFLYVYSLVYTYLCDVGSCGDVQNVELRKKFSMRRKLK
jgi:hypothetical protein